MTNNDTEYARYAATAQGAIELAAASATAEVSRLFRWLSTRSGPKQKQIADLLKVSEGRVSQVLNGDGNVTVAALAKYARAYGYTLSLTLTPIEDGTPSYPQSSHRRRRGNARSTDEPVTNRHIADHWVPLRGHLPAHTNDTTTSTGGLR
ncbi:helix-turn-helix domain-containing protein [Nocardia sp. NPDC058666]|uniref:helix-turn-helix domain-containing protein n=1 Tax=unclassified Nocardia TaxID=2637762 RepID=UPI0036567F2D